MLVPTLATIVVGVNGLVTHIDESNSADRTRTLSELSQAAGGLVDHLQNERDFGVMIATTQKNTAQRDDALKLYEGEHAQVDSAKLPYAQRRAALEDVPDKVSTLLVRLDRNLEDLPTTRSRTANGVLKVEDVKQNYGRLIDDLLQVRDTAAQLSTNTTLSDHLRAVSAVASAKDYVSQQRLIGHEVLAAGDFNAKLRRDFLLTDTGFTLALETLNNVGSDAERQLYQRVVSGMKATAATNLTVQLEALQGANTTNIPFNSQQWEEAMTGYNSLFREVERQLDAGVVDLATDQRDAVNQRVFIETSALLGMLLLAIMFAWLVARSMARSLRELRQGALSVAQFGLPQAVSRLRDPSLSSSLTPAQVADQVAEPLPVRSRDEFGQVTEAFNAVHLEAVRTAAEQAALRSSVATMFVNLARRSQILVDRLIGHLDRLERGEEDPDRLAELFQLDHLATRMRRNDENLLVLAGADSTRVQRDPAALIDVLRAAQSEVEHYTRIEFGVVDRDIEVAAHAVNDMVHLVAELFDNATAFSPPNSTVVVEAQRVGDNAVLSVEDRGIGISREQLRELNERLANPPMVDVAVSRMMGLVVVARLANRHGVKVELRPAEAERGTVADVGLPPSVLTPSAGSDRPPAVPAFAAGTGEQPTTRSAFGEPLALESGRGGYPGGRPFDPNPPMHSGGMLGTGGRSVPAWSDLTGAPVNGHANGSNGANGFHGPRSNEPIPPLPQGYGSPSPQGFQPPQGFQSPQGPPQGFPAPQGFQENPDLPQRRNGDTHRPDDTGSFGANIPRQLPANPETQGRNPFGPPVSSPPVPSAPPSPTSAPPGAQTSPPAAPNGASQRSAPPAWPPVAGERGTSNGGAPHVPESLAAALDMTAELPRYRPDRTGANPQISRSEPQSAPPASTAGQSEADRSAASAAAGHQAATAQAAEAQATAAAQIAAAQAAARQRDMHEGSEYADETMELPIFRELESAWFRTAKPTSEDSSPDAPAQNAPAQNAPAQKKAATQKAAAQSSAGAQSSASSVASSPAATTAGAPASIGEDSSPVTTQRFSTADPVRPPAGVPQQVPSPSRREDRVPDRDAATVGAVSAPGGGGAASPWQTAADEGWQAARAASEMPVDTTTTAGLPKRTPMAQLVPGGVDRGGNSVQRRTPEGVRGLLSAYHRGVQRGRTKEQSTNPGETPGGQQSYQAGKEHEA
ncbi:hypothetical protein GCM10012284_17850 [Mangrovihabitans endophyticus]|uniref:histidine kinase n=2 Tax=Mangrovihabitans endophyticus TaxID=1751298 RepID=A0A8J3BYY1_9ACTN|nr:hypothetical protein GCM10012284_17850 [Mangrovihabitans endophyticus]